MHTPSHFSEDRLPVLHDAINNARLATLVTLGGGDLHASHVPLMLDAQEGPYGTLYGHLARGNVQGQSVDPAVNALAIFMGPDAYITPTWYETKRTSHKVVPTWNYVAVHAYGNLELIDDPVQLLSLVTKLTDRHEDGLEEPWAVADAPDDFIEAMLKGIVGFKLRITRLEGKWKMSQNRSQADQEGVVAGLNSAGAEAEANVAKLMAAKI